ncbi:Peptidase A31, hydrogen uptake protein [mine drainage metagenome]|uniref:Peptidase A31, hydrogen uptake protein n=1 Tax=mine drainage metagenome TaxID=410659 RepID=T1B143_9ZZZZ
MSDPIAVRPREVLDAMTSAVPLVIGLGNPHRGDDAFGLVVVRRLRPRLCGVGTLVEQEVGGAELLDVWTGRERVWVVDAVRAGGLPGTNYRIEVGKEALPARLAASSSHGISLAQAVALGQVLHQLPSRLVIHGVEPAGFGTGKGLSPEVAAAVETVARRIEAEVRGTETVDRPVLSRGGPHA